MNQNNAPQRFQGSNQSKDPREVQSLVPKGARAPGFATDEEWLQFKDQVMRAHANGLVPRGIDSPEKALVIALKGKELGLDPIYALSQIFMIGGKAGLQAELMRALVYKKYPGAKMEYRTPPEKRHKEATFLFQRPGGGEQFFTFSIEDAFDAKVVVKDPKGKDGYSAAPSKPTWDTARQDMLVARCTSKGVRTVFPECVMGAGYTPEELESIPQEMARRGATELDAEFGGNVGNGTTAKIVDQHGIAHVEQLAPAPNAIDAEYSQVSDTAEKIEPQLEREQMRQANAPVKGQRYSGEGGMGEAYANLRADERGEPRPYPIKDSAPPQAPLTQKRPEAKAEPTAPAAGDHGVAAEPTEDPGECVITFGRLVGKKIKDVPKINLEGYVEFLDAKRVKNGEVDPDIDALIKKIKAFLAR